MGYLSDLDTTSRSFRLLLLSIVCVGSIAFAFRRRGLVHKMRVAWRLGKVAGERRNSIREQARLVSDDKLMQELALQALACQNRDDQYTDPLDLEEGLRALQEYLDTH